MLLAEVAKEFSRVAYATIIPALRRAHNPHLARMEREHAEYMQACQHAKRAEGGIPRVAEMPAMKVTLGTPSVLYVRAKPVGPEFCTDGGTGEFKPRNITANVPSPGFVLLHLVRISNLAFMVGGTIDAWQWAKAARRPGYSMHVPDMTFTTSVTLLGAYTGLVPEGMEPGAEFEFKLSFEGFELKEEPLKAADNKAPAASPST